jgi:hypothetical protein
MCMLCISWPRQVVVRLGSFQIISNIAAWDMGYIGSWDFEGSIHQADQVDHGVLVDIDKAVPMMSLCLLKGLVKDAVMKSELLL